MTVQNNRVDALDPRATFVAFAVPKEVSNQHIRTIQTNAIHSWVRIFGAENVVLFAVSSEIAAFAKEIGVPSVPVNDVNEFNTPFLSGIFHHIDSNFPGRTKVYLNADIIIKPNFLGVFGSKRRSDFLAITRRVDVDVTQQLSDSELSADALQNLQQSGKPHPSAGSDIFVYTAQIGVIMPRFLVGRACWDNWFIHIHKRKSIPVYDYSSYHQVIHQNHDYSHVVRGDTPSVAYHNSESEHNISIMRQYSSVNDDPSVADYVIDSSGKRVKNQTSIAYRKELARLQKKFIRYNWLNLLDYVVDRLNRRFGRNKKK